MEYIQKVFYRIKSKKKIILITIGSLVLLLFIGVWLSGTGEKGGNYVLKSDSVTASVLESWDGEVHEYDYTEAPDHVGEKASISGKILRVFTSKTDTTFLDFCERFDACPFSAVIFASDKDKFPDLSKYEGKVNITGVIKSYQGRAEIIVSDPGQIAVE